MQDTLSAMREFRFLEDKRNGGGLTPSEEGRYQELASQLQQASAPPPSVDPVVYAQELIAQGHDPVQAFLHVGFSLEQLAASGYDVSAYQQAAAVTSADPQAYAAALIAQGYDAVTAYTAAGLPVPEEAPVAAPPEVAAAPAPQPAHVEPHDLAFAEADLIEEVPHPSIPDDGTGGWQVESHGELSPASPMTRPELEVWRTPAQPVLPLPDPGPVPHIDTAAPVADVMPAWEPSGPSAAELAASAVASEEVSSPFEPTNPEPLPPGVSEALPPSRELPAVVPEVEALPELAVEGLSAVPEVDGLPELELAAAAAAPLEPEPAAVELAPAPVGLDAREMDFAGDTEEPLPELDLDRSGLASAEVASGSRIRPLSEELELPALERHESEWDMGADAAALPALEPVPPTSEPFVGSETELEAAPLDAPPLELDRPTPPRTNTGLLPVLDASALSAEVIQEGTPTRMMPALAVERMASRSAMPTQTEWSSEITSEELPVIPEPEPLPAALAPEPALPELAPDLEAAPALAEEWAVAAAPTAIPEISAEPYLDPGAIAALPAMDVGEAHLAGSEAPAPAPVEGAGPAWPTVAELSDWSSADKGEYAAWSESAGGLHPYLDIPEPELVARLVGTPAVPMPEAAVHHEEPAPVPASGDLFAAAGAWQETAAPEWEPRTPDVPAPLPELAPEAVEAAPPEPALPEWGAPLPEEPPAAPAFAMPSAQVQAAPQEWSAEEPAAGEVVLEAGELVEDEVPPPANDFAIPEPSIRAGKVRPPSEPRPAPQPVVGPPLQVVMPPAVTRKPSVVVDLAAMAPPPPPPPKPMLDIGPARVAQGQSRAPSIVIDQGLLGEEAPMAVDEGDFSPGTNGAAKGAAQSLRLAGERRVIVHMMDGSVRRGSFHELDLNQAELTLASQTGIVEVVPRDRIKAIFFMLAPGAAAPAIEGSKLRVTFTDGRNIVGFSNGYDPNAVGFFIIPADARTNTERVFVLKAAIRGVANG